MDHIDIKALRERAGWDQAEMAEYLGVDRSSVSRMENGQAPRGPVIKLLQQLTQRLDAAPTPARPTAPAAAEVGA